MVCVCVCLRLRFVLLEGPQHVPLGQCKTSPVPNKPSAHSAMTYTFRMSTKYSRTWQTAWFRDFLAGFGGLQLRHALQTASKVGATSSWDQVRGAWLKIHERSLNSIKCPAFSITSINRRGSSVKILRVSDCFNLG